MSKKGGYIGGSTIIGFGSDWFSYSDPKDNRTTGETRADKTRRVQADASKAKKLKKKKFKSRKKAEKLLNPPKERAREIEERRLAKIEQNRARLTEQPVIGPLKPSREALKQQDRLSRLVVEKRQKKKLVVPKSSIKDASTSGDSS